jgi:SOS-response transcriptional repressor LexA
VPEGQRQDVSAQFDMTIIKLISLNEKYPDIIIRKDSKVDFKVIGKVVDIIAKL